ncbi:MAG TPA: phage tail protein [Polyangiaceae bacterium]|nr:phage tail protein [Polyangiaceae bacterium]
MSLLDAPPLPAFRYWIMLKNSASFDLMSLGGALLSLAAGFSDCSGLETSLETYDYAEGGFNGFVHRFPTRTKPADIVLKRGLHFTTDLWLWMQQVIDGHYQRKDGVIVLCTQNGTPCQAWCWKNGLPLKWTGPTLSGSANALAMESLTIAHEGLSNLGLDIASAALDAVGAGGLLG